MINEYTVTSRDNRWWIMNYGHRLGPYVSMLVATQSAISSARADLKKGIAARVTVESDSTHVVYDSSDADAPGETVGK